jgi:iron complex outermembrane receptor protein
MRRGLSLVLLLVLTSSLDAQKDSLISAELPAIEVLDQSDIDKGQSILSPSPKSFSNILPFSSTLSDLLSLHSTATIRDRGNGTLSTMSIRGGSSQQSQVLWNGANINNSMLGLSDISMLPPAFMEEIRLHPVRENEGYQPIGGILSLNNKLPDSSKLVLGAQFGEFNFEQYHLKIARPLNDKTTFSLKGILTDDLQNFPYLPEHSSILLPDRQINAHHQHTGGMAEVTHKFNKHHRIEIRSWLQGMRREIPPTLNQRNSSAVQSDSFQRHQLIWVYGGHRYRHTFNYTYRSEVNHFLDLQNALDSRNLFQSHQFLSQHRLLISDRWSIKTGANVESTSFITDNYSENRSFFNWQGYGRVNYFFNNQHYLQTELRQAGRNHSIAPMTGHLAWGYTGQRHFWQLQISRAHRYPSANDLFWNPGGNEDLEPELSHQIQASYQYSGNATFFDGLVAEVYYKNVENWILWAPLNSIFFRPHNILEVSAAGLELSMEKSKQWSNHFSMSFRGVYNYQYVRNTGDFDSPVAQKGSNLIYMPEHQWSFHCSASYRQFSLLYQHLHQSVIFTRPNRSESIPSRHIGHWILAYSNRWWQQDIQLFFRLNNAWEQDYFFQPGVPAPGRQWRFGIIFEPKF